MNKRKKEQRKSAINIENNSASYCPILTAITVQIIIKNQLRKTDSWSEEQGVLQTIV